MDNKMVMVALFDKVSNAYGFPVCFENVEVAKRNFVDMVSTHPLISKHPSDFVLYRIGYYDQKTGQIFSKFDAETDIIINGFEVVAINEVSA